LLGSAAILMRARRNNPRISEIAACGSAILPCAELRPEESERRKAFLTACRLRNEPPFPHGEKKTQPHRRRPHPQKKTKQQNDDSGCAAKNAHGTNTTFPITFYCYDRYRYYCARGGFRDPPPHSPGGGVRVVCPRAGLCPGLARSRENPAEPPRGATAAAASERNAEGERCKTDSESLK